MKTFESQFWCEANGKLALVKTAHCAAEPGIDMFRDCLREGYADIVAWLPSPLGILVITREVEAADGQMEMPLKLGGAQ